MKKKTKKVKKSNWTIEDEEILIQNVRENVTNLKKAFEKTSLEICRTPNACANHWYVNTSIKGGHCLFVTLSGQHIAVNRKNSKGKASNVSLFKKILNMLGLQF